MASGKPIDVAALLAENSRLREENARLRQEVGQLPGLRQEVERLQSRVDELLKRLDEAERAAKRQAAPFRRNKRKEKPGRPGRKAGHPGACRKTPPAVDETQRAEPLRCCPDCGTPVFAQYPCENYQVDIPLLPPKTTKFVFEKGWCPHCQKWVASRHPDQTSTAVGAAACHLGPRALAIAVDLKYQHAVPFRKVTEILWQFFQLRVTAGALAQASHRVAAKAAPTRAALRQELALQPVAHSDATGWWVGSAEAQLWVVCSAGLTDYEVRNSGAATVVLEVLGAAFSGWLMRDGAATFDTRLVHYKMLRCLLHLDRNAKKLAELQTRGAVRSPRYFHDWVKQVLELKRQVPLLTTGQYQDEAGKLVEWFDWFVNRPYTDERNAAFAERLAKRRDQIVPILEKPELPPTNNLGERQLRNAIRTRKIAAGNETNAGAKTFAALAGIAASCRQQGVSTLEVIRRILLSPVAVPLLFWVPEIRTALLLTPPANPVQPDGPRVICTTADPGRIPKLPNSPLRLVGNGGG